MYKIDGPSADREHDCLKDLESHKNMEVCSTGKRLVEESVLCFCFLS